MLLLLFLFYMKWRRVTEDQKADKSHGLLATVFAAYDKSKGPTGLEHTNPGRAETEPT